MFEQCATLTVGDGSHLERIEFKNGTIGFLGGQAGDEGRCQAEASKQTAGSGSKPKAKIGWQCYNQVTLRLRIFKHGNEH